MTTTQSDSELSSALQQLITTYADEQKMGLEGISAETLLDLITCSPPSSLYFQQIHLELLLTDSFSKRKRAISQLCHADNHVA
jgi:hypothetical protein